VSKCKRKTDPDIRTRTRQPPAARILAQRARRAELYVGSQENRQPPGEDMGGPCQNLSPPRLQQSLVTQQAQGVARQSSIEELYEDDQIQKELGSEKEDQARHYETQAASASRREKSLPPLCPSLTCNTEVLQTPVAQDSQSVPAAKRRVSFAFSYCDCCLSYLKFQETGIEHENMQPLERKSTVVSRAGKAKRTRTAKKTNK
jgi:hypothetical protein